MNKMTDLKVFGDEKLESRSLRYTVVENAQYIPKSFDSWYDNDPFWGIYYDGLLLRDSAYFRGPGEKPVGQSAVVPSSPGDYEFVAGTYMYGGTIQPHYGHFLFDGIGRFWHQERSYRFLVQGPTTVAEYFKYAHVKEIFGALGLGEDNFIRFDRPCIIEKLIVPEPCIVELNSVNTAYSDLCSGIGRRFDAPSWSGERLVYVSKSELKNGIWAADNEVEIENILVGAGIKVVHPQRMSLAEQIEMFASAITIGMEGSAFHTAALSPQKTRSIIILKFGHTFSNFTLIDKVKGNDVHYIIPKHNFEKVGSVGGIDAMYHIPDPLDIAEQVLRTVEKIG